MIAEFPLGELLPDAADFKNPGLTTANNCVPGAGGYYPFPGLTQMALTGATITGRPLGSFWYERTDGTPCVALGTTTDLFLIVGLNVTASGLGLSLGPTQYWQFERFNSMIIATTKPGAVYRLANADVDTTFTLLPGSPPQAVCVDRVGDFLMLGNLTDIDTSAAPYRIRWSQYNNPAGTWVDDIATQAGAVDMDPQYGPVTGIEGGRYDLIFQKYGTSRIAYVGGNNAFAKEVIDDQRGCIAPPSLTRVGSMVFGLAHDGFFMCDGSSMNMIGAGKIFEYFLAASDANFRDQTSVAIDWVRRCVIWSFVPLGGTTFTRQMVYSWEYQRWTTASITADYIFSATQAGLTLEQLDATYPNLDTMPLSLDSGAFLGLGRSFRAISGGVVSEFSGAPLGATLETGEWQAETGKRSYVTAITPIVESSGGVSASVGARANYAGETVTYSTPATQGPYGYCPASTDGRYLRVRLTMPAGLTWRKASALQIEFVPSGVA